VLPAKGDAPWKAEPLLWAQCWAPNRRIMVAQDGTRRVAAGGISRTLTEAEIQAEMEQDKATSWTRGHRREDGRGWTLPFHASELDQQGTDEIKSLISGE
jgi:hypothetical protein